MITKIYHLDTCNTCKRIISEFSGATNLHLQNIKEEPITEGDLAFLKIKSARMKHCSTDER